MLTTPPDELPPPSGALVVKIGGSTLGEADTTLDDVAALAVAGWRVVLVHGGGPLISQWLDRLGIPSQFERGLRVTTSDVLDVAAAALAGLVNKSLVAGLRRRGADAFGLSGADGGLLRCELEDPKLGLVGSVVAVRGELLEELLDLGTTPVVAPIGLGPRGELLNVNADAAAGALAAALRAGWLVFATDVDGVRDRDGQRLARLGPSDVRTLVRRKVIAGGMLPKVDGAMVAAAAGCRAVILDARAPRALVAALRGRPLGTRVVPGR